MAIRPRKDSPFHEYLTVYDDLRSGRLTHDEYNTMVEEDSLEAERIIAAAVDWEIAVSEPSGK